MKRDHTLSIYFTLTTDDIDKSTYISSKAAPDREQKALKFDLKRSLFFLH